ncbi:MAG: polysaccharide biosynthesis C-terminal domain-containing protein [Candidatus Thorarchaeota archaeon]
MEEDKESKQRKREMEREYKSLAKNSILSFIHSYSGFFLSIITSFIMARIISQITWGFLIIALSYVAIFTLTLTFLPPSLGLSFNYFIPRDRALKQNTKLKSFIKKSLIIRLFFVLATFLVSLLFMFLLIDIFSIEIGGYEYLLYLLSPLIIIQGIDQVFNDILRGFNLFTIVYYMLLVRNLIYIGGLIFLFLNVNLVSLTNISIIFVLSNLIPFIIDFFIIFRIQRKIRNTEESPLTFKDVFSRLIKYGSHLSIKTYLDRFTREFKTILVGTFQLSGIVTGYNIGVHYSDVSFEAIGSFNRPLTISFSSLDAKNKTKEIEGIYRNLFHYAQFFILLISGFLFFLTDIYLSLIYSDYSESFALYSVILKVLILATIFTLKPAFFYSLLRASNKVKYIVPIRIINFVINLVIFLVSLIYFGIIGAVIAVIIGNIFSFILFTFLVLKLFNIKLDVYKTICLYTSFFFALGFSLFLEKLFLAEFNYFILKNLHLLFLQDFQFLTLITFLILFFLFLILLDIFSATDLTNLESIFSKDNFIDKIIRKSLRLLKKVIK